MKRLLCVFLALAMLFSVLMIVASCNTPSETTEDTTKSPTVNTEADKTEGVETKEQPSTGNSGETDVPSTEGTTKATENDGHYKYEGYEDVDFGGKVFRFGTFIDSNTVEFNDEPDFWTEGINGDAVNDAIYERNQVMKKLYNCTIEADSGWTNFNEDVASGAGKYLGGSTAYAIASTFTNGNFYNVLKFDIDYNGDGWDHAFFRDLTCNGKLFAVCGDFSIRAMRTPWIMYYNKDVYESKFADIDIYEMVRNKEWTFDKLMEFISKIKTDVDGDQVYKATSDADSDIMGLVTTGHIYRTFFFSSGLRMVTSNYGNFKVALDNPNGSDTVDKLIEVMQTEGFSTAGYTIADNCMMNGTTLFVANILGQLYNYSNAENLRLGIIPCPLYQEGGEYATYCDNHACFLGISTAYANIDEISDFLALFAFHSSKFVRPAFIEQIKYTYASDEDSGDMLDLILESRTYDAGYFMSLTDGFYGAWQGMLESGKNQWSQAIGRHVKTAESNIQKFEDRIAQIDDSY